VTVQRQLHLAVALDGAGWHPAAWREPDARPQELFTAEYWTDLIQEAERGFLDFATIEDSLKIQSTKRGLPDDRVDQVRGRLDAVLTAARVAPQTSAIGIVPVVTTTHTEPFHVSKAIATLDFVSDGRAGMQVRVSGTGLEARQFGRRLIPDPPSNGTNGDAIHDLFAEADDFVEVVRRLWDSWEDDAEIRDVVTGRFIDRDKLHYTDFEGRWFSVKGPSITPRPPQGQPIVTALAHVPVAFDLAARSADLVFVTPMATDGVRSVVRTLDAQQDAVSRSGDRLRVFADLLVFLDDDGAKAQRRKARLDDLDGRVLRSDAYIFAGTPTDLADLLVEWHQAGIDGFRLRPGAIPHDLGAIVHKLVGVLQDRAVFRRHYDDLTLRTRLGLALPANRYATT
jgi:alkanesulfonate monooxygenase SsuD/methylene tetrahydromethanopterin reductase-like flavin-dependent oxidoreductase (luciferase family)